MPNLRPSWNEYFMSLAHAASTRATCDRKKVGCVLVREKRVIATGFNGSLSGLPHCDDVGHDMEDNHCIRTQHAESNAVAQAACAGIRLQGAAIYVNTFPCWPCFRLLVSAGVVAVFYDDTYRPDPRVKEAAATLFIGLVGPDAWRSAPPSPAP